MSKEALEVRNLASIKKEDLKNKKIKFTKDGDVYYGLLRGFGAKALKLEIFVSYDDIVDFKDSRSLEKELWERMCDEYSYK